MEHDRIRNKIHEGSIWKHPWNRFRARYLKQTSGKIDYIYLSYILVFYQFVALHFILSWVVISIILEVNMKVNFSIMGLSMEEIIGLKKEEDRLYGIIIVVIFRDGLLAKKTILEHNGITCIVVQNLYALRVMQVIMIGNIGASVWLPTLGLGLVQQ